MTNEIDPRHLPVLQSLAKDKNFGQLLPLTGLYLDACAMHESMVPQSEAYIRQRATIGETLVVTSTSRESGVFVQLRGVRGKPLEMAVGKLWSYEATVPQSSHVGIMRWT